MHKSAFSVWYSNKISSALVQYTQMKFEMVKLDFNRKILIIQMETKHIHRFKFI